MCRMLVVGNDHSGCLGDKIRIFTNLLGLSVNSYFTEDYQSAASFLSSGQNVDVVMSEFSFSPERSLLAGYNTGANSHVKWIWLTGETSGCYSNVYTLANPVDIKSFYQVFSQVSPEAAAHVPADSKSDRWYLNQDILLDRVLQVLQIIRRDYRKDLSLNDLADQVFTTPCYLCTLFTKFLGVSPIVYLNEYRMDKAVDLLLHSDRNLTDICEMVGYRNLPYFCTRFKNKYRMTPTQFRREHGILAVS